MIKQSIRMKNYILFAAISFFAGRLTGQQKPSWNTGYYSSGTALKFTESHNKLLPTTDSVGNVFMAFHYTDTLILDGKIYRANGKNSFVIRKVDKYGTSQFNLFAQARSGARKVVLSDLFALRDGGFAIAVSTDDTLDLGKVVLGVKNRNVDESYVLRFNADGSLRYKIHFYGAIPNIRPGYKNDLVVYADFKSPDLVTINGKSYDPIYNRDLILQIAADGTIGKTYNRFSSLVDWTEDIKGNMYLFSMLYSSDTAKGQPFVDTTLFPSAKSGNYRDHVILGLKQNGNVKWVFRLDSAHGSNSGLYKFGIDKSGRIYFCDNIGRAFKYQGKVLMSSPKLANRALFGVLDSNGKLLRYFFDNTYGIGEEQSISMYPTAWLGDDVEIKLWAGQDFAWPKKASVSSSILQSCYYNFLRDTFFDVMDAEPSLAERRNYFKRQQRWGVSTGFGAKGSAVFVGNDLYTNYGGNDYMGFFFDPDIKVSTKEIVFTPQVAVYPNPTIDGKLHLESIAAMHSLVLLSVNGQQVAQFTQKGESIDLELPTLRPGLYFIQGVCNEHRFTKAFVIDK
jgi:hypothetical protein